LGEMDSRRMQVGEIGSSINLNPDQI
jgi:hypothetical protein